MWWIAEHLAVMAALLSPGLGYRAILKEINPKYSLEGLVLKLKLQYLVT